TEATETTETTETTRFSKNCLVSRIFTSNLFKLDHDRLSKQWPFWISIFFPLIISILLSIPLWIDTTLDISANGYNKFLSIYRLPIGVLSLSIPLVAIVAHIHRTIQTAEQIKSARDKNVADGFFSHHKFMIEAFSKIPEKTAREPKVQYQCKIEEPYDIYNLFFEGSSYNNGVRIDNFDIIIKEIQLHLETIEQIIIRAKKNKLAGESNQFELFQLSGEITKLELYLSLTRPIKEENSVIMIKLNDYANKIIIPFETELELKEKFKLDLFFLKKIIQSVDYSVNVVISDVIFYFSSVTKPKYMLFTDEFSRALPTTEKYGTASAQSKNRSNLHNEFDEYKKKLELKDLISRIP
ncbi:TPA: hypothetical protein ACJ7RJ_003493, partial [Yersinia enterocolitica]